MDVKIRTTCGRCGKIDEADMSLEDAQKLEQTQAARAVARSNLQDKFNETFDGAHPEIIIAVRAPGADGYSVKYLDDLCERPNANRNKGCRPRVMTLVHSIFTVEPPKKKEPKQPKKKTKTDPPKKG